MSQETIINLPDPEFDWKGFRQNREDEYAEIITMCEEIGEFLLSLNTKNRRYRMRVIEGYVRDIKAGKWEVTCQGIGIALLGWLVDGQHRLLALKQLGWPPVKMLLVWNLSETAQQKVDQHAKRSARDYLRLMFDVRVVSASPSIARMIVKTRSTWRMNPTLSEIIEVVHDYADEIEFVTNIPKKASFFAAPYLTSFVLAAKQFPLEQYKIRTFMERVEKGEMLSAKSPEFHLRNFLLNTRGTDGGETTQQHRFLKTQKALGLFFEGKETGVLKL